MVFEFQRVNPVRADLGSDLTFSLEDSHRNSFRPGRPAGGRGKGTRSHPRPISSAAVSNLHNSTRTSSIVSTTTQCSKIHFPNVAALVDFVPFVGPVVARFLPLQDLRAV